MILYQSQQSPYSQIEPILDQCIGTVGIHNTLAVLRKVANIHTDESALPIDQAQRELMIANFILDKVATVYQIDPNTLSLRDKDSKEQGENPAETREKLQDARLMATFLVSKYNTEWTLARIGHYFNATITRQAIKYRLQAAEEALSIKHETPFKRHFKEISTEISVFLTKI